MSTANSSIPPQVVGHLGFLSEDQSASLERFREILLQDGKYYHVNPRLSHDDPTLLRFLRARRFNPAKAREQFQSAEQWRQKHDVDTLYATFDVEEMKSSQRFYPRWTGRRDRFGRPLYVYRIGTLTSPMMKELEAVKPERRYQRIIALYELLTRYTCPLSSDLPHEPLPVSALGDHARPLAEDGTAAPESRYAPITSTTSIIDLAGVSIGTLWNWKGHLQQASTLATANYPETLGAIAVVNAPSFFPTVWSWIKAWFDENTRNKITILSASDLTPLHKLVAPENLPRTYGGELDWTFEDEPLLDDAAKGVMGDKMPYGPIEWRGKVVRAQQPSPDEAKSS